MFNNKNSVVVKFNGQFLRYQSNLNCGPQHTLMQYLCLWGVYSIHVSLCILHLFMPFSSSSPILTTRLEISWFWSHSENPGLGQTAMLCVSPVSVVKLVSGTESDHRLYGGLCCRRTQTIRFTWITAHSVQTVHGPWFSTTTVSSPFEF